MSPVALERLIEAVQATPNKKRHLLYQDRIVKHQRVTEVIAKARSDHPVANLLDNHSPQELAEGLLRLLLEGSPLLSISLYDKFTRISFGSPSHEQGHEAGDGQITKHLQELVALLPEQERGLLTKLAICLSNLAETESEDVLDAQVPPAHLK